MVENDSPLIKVLVNELSYLLKNANLKKLLKIMARSINASKSLEIIL